MPTVAKNHTTTWTPQRIKALRLRLGLTQAQAAARVGVTRRAWAGWEGGEVTPTRPILILLNLLKDKKI